MFFFSQVGRVWLTKVSPDIGQDNSFNMVHQGVARQGEGSLRVAEIPMREDKMQPTGPRDCELF